MHALVLQLQLQLLLAALGALLPRVPEASRAKLAALVDLAAQALLLGERAGGAATELAMKLQRIRADVEAMAAEGRALTPDRIDEAWARVEAASRAFRAAVE